MNETLRLLHERKSCRSYADRPVERDTVDAIVQAAMRAPTAGGMMLYAIIEIADQSIKDKLAVSCDNQPFIARAPLVLLFCADYQRWWDLYMASDVPGYCAEHDLDLRAPGEGDLMLAASDAIIAAQNAVVAAEALGLGSCYIGDILEQFEFHRELLHLPQYVLPVTMLCFGYPNEAAKRRKLVPRMPQETVHFVDRYHRLDEATLTSMVPEAFVPNRFLKDAANFGQHSYVRKFGADFSVEMTRSVRAMIASWTADEAWTAKHEEDQA